MHLRYLYNMLPTMSIAPGVASAIFFFVRENAYASMFRYNRSGSFNVPYGGITYNRKDLGRKIASLRSRDLQAHLSNTVLENLDFEEFLGKYPPQAGDFLFLDPPYDSDFSTYTRNEFGPRDQERLANYVLTRCPARFLLVIKNTPLIRALYEQKGLTIQAFEKKYLVSFQDRNERETDTCNERLLSGSFGCAREGELLQPEGDRRGDPFPARLRDNPMRAVLKGEQVRLNLRPTVFPVRGFHDCFGTSGHWSRQ